MSTLFWCTSIANFILEPAQFSAQAQRPGASIGSLTPAFAPPDLYIAPQFDEFGDPLTQIEDPEDYNYYEDYPEDYYDTFEPESRPRLPRPHNSNLGPDLQPRLPQFDILHATEVLRSRDKDQSQLLNPGQVNAGVLPLAYENTGPKLGLFPPLLDPWKLSNTHWSKKSAKTNKNSSLN